MTETTTQVPVAIGAHEGVPFEDYDRWDRVSGGFLFTMMEKSPAHAVAEKEERAKAKDTPTLRFGSAFHCAMLEPDALELRYIGKPDGMSFATREGKEWRASQTGTILEPLPGAASNPMDHLRRMQDAVFGHKWAGPLLREAGALREVSLSWEESWPYQQSTGSPVVRCKGRPDFIAWPILIDLKTCLDARPRKFGQQANDLGYFFKMAWYADGLVACGLSAPQEVYLIAVEKAPPYAVNVFMVPTETMNAARAFKFLALSRYADCAREGLWPAYPEDIHPIVLPPWRLESIYGGKA